MGGTWGQAVLPVENTCEGNVWNSGQFISGSFAAVTALIYICTTIYRRFYTEVHTLITSIHMWLGIMAISQAVWLFGHFQLALIMQNISITVALLKIYVIIFTDFAWGPLTYFVLAGFSLSFTIIVSSAVTLNGVTGDNTTTGLAGVPYVLLVVIALLWICIPPREVEKRAGLVIHERRFFARVFLSGAIAIALWSVDTWACDHHTKWLFLSYPFAVLFFAYFILEFTTYLAYMMFSASRPGAYIFEGNWLMAEIYKNRDRMSSSDIESPAPFSPSFLAVEVTSHRTTATGRKTVNLNATD